MSESLWALRAARVAAAIGRTSAWVAARVTDHGFRGCEDSLLAHYKAPFCLAHAGDPLAAVRVLRHLVERFHDAGGFHRDVAVRAPWTGGTYANAWIAAGAVRLGLDDIAGAALARIDASIDPAIGAPPNLPDVAGGAPLYDGGTVARVAETMLVAGRIDTALRLGRMLRRLYDRQPAAADWVTWCVDADDRLLPAGAGGADATTRGLSVGAPGQVYWFLGFALRVFARAYRIDRDPAWLRTSLRIRDWLDRCAPDRLACISNAKLGWGAAEMYAVTGDPAWAGIATAVIDWLVDVQRPSGVWLRRQDITDGDQPDAVSLDTALERMMYLSDMLRALALRP